MSEPTSTLETDAPQVRLHASFTEDFWLQQADGEADATDLSLLLTTLWRSGENAGEPFQAGPLAEVIAWSAIGSIRLIRTSGGYDFTHQLGVVEWADVRSVWNSAADAELPLVATHEGILMGLGQLPELAWAGIRYQDANRWTEQSGAACPQGSHPRDAAMQVLQIDVLLKSHAQPRGRMALLFEKGSFWAWADARENYMMAFTADAGEGRIQQMLMRYGEAFLIA